MNNNNKIGVEDMKKKTMEVSNTIAIFIILFTFSIEVSGQLADCQNGGTPINSTTCQCPGFVDGQLCEIIKCQRFSIPDMNRCVCPPGWYDKYCGIRGCRPAVEDNLDLNKRSFIIVFNTKTTMRNQLDELIKNFDKMIDKITTDQNTNTTDNWIANFIIYGFVMTNKSLEVEHYITESSVDALRILSNWKLKEGDEEQPVLGALQKSQQIYTQMKSHSIVLVFTDSPSSDATPWSHRFTDKTIEQNCLQISLLWRSKIFFILSSLSNTNTSMDSIDVYRRLSLTNHGDYFFTKHSNETGNLLTKVVATNYFAENIATGYGMKGNKRIDLMSEPSNKNIFILVTTDANKYPKIPSVNNAVMLSSGYSYNFYITSSTNSIDITSDIDTVYNYRIYIQSKNTVMFDYNDDMNIDVGNGMAVIGIPMSATMQTYGLDGWDNSSYIVTKADNTMIRDKYYSYERPQLDCTFNYGFNTWKTLSCPPGPLTQVHHFNYNGYTVQRVTAGYCIESDHNQNEQTSQMRRENIRIDGESGKYCPEKNIDAINDPRLSVANQYVFILEQHSSNKAVYQTLAKEINDIVRLVETSTNTTYKKEFTLIIHDDRVSRVVLSHYNADIFAQKLIDIVNNLILIDNLDGSLGLLSIVQAQKMNIMPTSQVYYFTNQAMKNVNNMTTRTWDIVNRDIEFNFITIADGITTEIFALPWQLELVQKMSNGRIIPISSNETSILNLFADMMSMNALTTDTRHYNCYSKPIEVELYIEPNAESVVLQMIGNGLKNVDIRDGKGTPVVNSVGSSYQNRNFISMKYNMSSYSPGTWKMSIQTSMGGCQITVRHRSSNNVMLGFTSSKHDDMRVESQIITQRAQKEIPVYVPARIVGIEDEMKTGNIEIKIVNTNRYDKTISYYNSTIVSRDDGSCAFNYMSEDITIPKSELTQWILTAFDSDKKLIMRRILYYYQRSPIDDTVCHGGNVDEYGQCICPDRYTGEYCWDRICAPGATYSYGICSCPPGFYGDFCEIMLIIPSNLNINQSTTVSIEKHVIQTTTSSIGYHHNTLYILVFVYMFLYI